MSSVCPELLAHLRGFGFGFLAIEVTPNFQLPPSNTCPGLAFPHPGGGAWNVRSSGMGMRMGLVSDFRMLRSLLLPHLIWGGDGGSHRPLNFKVNFRSPRLAQFSCACAGATLSWRKALCNLLLHRSQLHPPPPVFPVFLLPRVRSTRAAVINLSVLPGGWDILLGQRLLGRCLPYMSWISSISSPYFSIFHSLFHFTFSLMITLWRAVCPNPVPIPLSLNWWISVYILARAFETPCHHHSPKSISIKIISVRSWSYLYELSVNIFYTCIHANCWTEFLEMLVDFICGGLTFGLTGY